MNKTLIAALLISLLPISAMAEAGVSAGRAMNAPGAGSSDAAYNALIASAPQREAAVHAKVEAGEKAEKAFASDPVTQKLQRDLNVAQSAQKQAAMTLQQSFSPFNAEQAKLATARMTAAREALDKHRAAYMVQHPEMKNLDLNRNMLAEMRQTHHEVRCKHGNPRHENCADVVAGGH